MLLDNTEPLHWPEGGGLLRFNGESIRNYCWSATREVELKVDKGFSRYPYEESLQRMSNGDVLGNQTPIGHLNYKEKEAKLPSSAQKIPLEAKLIVDSERQPKIAELHQADNLIYAISPEVFQNALTLSVREGDAPAETKTVALPILGDGMLKISHDDQLLGKAALNGLNPNASHFSTISNLSRRIEKLPFYSTIGKLIESQAKAEANTKITITSNNPLLACREGFIYPSAGHKLLLSTDTPHETISTFLESTFKKTSQLDPVQSSPKRCRIDLDTMIFAVKSETKGWEFYHCKSGEDFNILAEKLKQRYQQEQVSVELITSIDARRRTDTQYDLDQLCTNTDGFQQKEIGEFIAAVQSDPTRHNIKIFFNQNGSAVEYNVINVPASSTT